MHTYSCLWPSGCKAPHFVSAGSGLFALLASIRRFRPIDCKISWKERKFHVLFIDYRTYFIFLFIGHTECFTGSRKSFSLKPRHVNSWNCCCRILWKYIIYRILLSASVFFFAIINRNVIQNCVCFTQNFLSCQFLSEFIKLFI